MVNIWSFLMEQTPKKIKMSFFLFFNVIISFAFCYKGVKVFPPHRCSWVCINS